MKYIWLTGSITVIAAGGAGFWLWQSHHKTLRHTLPIDRPAASSGNQTLKESFDPNAIPLNQAAPSNNRSGLSVAPGNSDNNLGQLTPQNDTSGSATAPKSSAPKALDPSTFGEYEKYKDDSSALFGELQVGTGDELTSGKKAAVYYKGWLTNGQLFDMSRPDKDGNLQPFIFQFGAHQVIPGWEQGLSGMKVGGVRLVIVPPAVGYGAKGQDPIPGNAVLVFQVQLLAVQ